MNKDKTYCNNKQCPFKDCDRHPIQITEAGVYSFAGLDAVCERYIRFLVNNL